MINRLEMILYKLFFWGCVPLSLFLIGWWSSISLKDNQEIFSIAFAGMGLGVLIDALFLKSKLKSLETLQTPILMGVYVFYSIMVLGFFMGVPVFNVLLGILAGRFMARVGLFHKLSGVKMNRLIHNTALFSALVMIGICVISGFIALKDPLDTAVNLQGMLGLNFEVTELMVYALVALGGLGLIITQYFLTLGFAHYELKHVYFDPADPFYRPIN